MKTICIPVFNRPDCLRLTLQSIEDHFMPHRGSWNIYLSLDSPGTKQVEQVALEFGLRLPIHAWKSGRPLGCSLNTFTVCHAAIADGAEAILFMDDDIILSPDALDLCDWYLSNPAFNDPKKYAGIALCRKEGNDPARPDIISASETCLGHFGQGWCFSRAVWFDFVLRNFWVVGPSKVDTHDWALCEAALNTDRTILRPLFARARHAGAVGYHGAGIGTFPDVIASCTRANYQLTC